MNLSAMPPFTSPMTESELFHFSLFQKVAEETLKNVPYNFGLLVAPVWSSELKPSYAPHSKTPKRRKIEELQAGLM